MMSFYPFFGTACCQNARYPAPSSLKNLTCGYQALAPAHAQVLVVFGRISRKKSAVLKDMYDALASKKLVIHIEGCHSAIADYATLQSLDSLVPIRKKIESCEVSLSDLNKVLHEIDHGWPST